MTKIFKNRIFLAIMSIVMALVIAFAIVPLVSRAISATKNVVVAKKDIQIGQKVTSDMLEILEVGKKGLASDYITNIKDVEGLYATTNIYAKDVITKRKVDKLLTSPEAKLRAMKNDEFYCTFKLGESSLVTLLPNDIVTVYATDAKGKVYIPPELEYVSVVCTSAEDGTQIVQTNQKNKNGEVYTPTKVTFILTQTQAQKLTSILKTDTVNYFLKYRGDSESIINAYLDIQSSKLYASNISN